MANVKISELSPASTPLTGTEVLPIVQAGNTVKVSTANVMSQPLIGQALNPRTAAEIAASVTPTDYAIPATEIKLERYGATGSGDAGAALTSATSVQIQNLDKIFLQAGRTYSALTWSPRTLSTPVRIDGFGAVLQGPVVNADFVRPAATVLLNGVTFSRWASAIERETSDGGSINRFRAFDSRFTEFTSIPINIEITLNNYWIERNIFDTITGNYALRVGENTYASQDTWKKGHIVGNHFADVSASSSTDAGAMTIYGKENVILGNNIENIDSVSGEAWGIYTKSRFTAIAFNTVTDVASSAGSSVWGINVKGQIESQTTSPQGFGNVVIGNFVRTLSGATTSAGYGIRLQTESVIAAANQVRDAGNTGISLDYSEAGISGAKGAILTNNLVKFATMNIAVGARISASLSDVYISQNIFENVLIGVRLDSIIGDETNWNVLSNTISADAASGSGVVVRRDHSLSGINISNNVVKSASNGIRFETGAGVLSNVRVYDNDLSSATTPFSGAIPADIDIRHTFKYQTTDNTVHNALVFELSDLACYLVEINVNGAQVGGGNYANYRRSVQVYRSGGSATLNGAVQDITPIVETDANWNATIAVSGNNLVITIKGNTGQTVNWKTQINVIGVTM